MIDFVFTRVMPIISFLMGAMLFIRFWKARDLLDAQTIRMVKQVKTMWGKGSNEIRYTKRDKTAAYKSGQKKFMEGIKGMIPEIMQPALEDFTPQEMQEYIFNPDTVNFFLKVKDLIGGFKLPEIKIPERKPRTRAQDDKVPTM